MARKPSTPAAPQFGPNGAVMNSGTMTDELREEYAREGRRGAAQDWGLIALARAVLNPGKALEIMSAPPRHPGTVIGGLFFMASMMAGGAMLALAAEKEPRWLPQAALGLLLASFLSDTVLRHWRGKRTRPSSSEERP